MDYFYSINHEIIQYLTDGVVSKDAGVNILDMPANALKDWNTWCIAYYTDVIESCKKNFKITIERFNEDIEEEFYQGITTKELKVMLSRYFQNDEVVEVIVESTLAKGENDLKFKHLKALDETWKFTRGVK